ncbi:MAG TPA: hypothetical protein VK483_08245 [Chitinophagaceae bacterium]|nr:hypothetical protein [Chitinophagaceae bacterium]
MKTKIGIAVLSIVFVFASCTKEYDCTDLQIRPAFIAFSPSDIDTFVLRKFKPADNFQNLIDTFMVTYGFSANYQTSNDTTTVFVTDGKNGIKAGYDWQIFIPAKNKTVFVSDIVSEKKTEKRGYGIFSLDPAPGCTNNIFSVKKDNQLINFLNPAEGYSLFIRN